MALLAIDTLVTGPKLDSPFLLESFHGREALSTSFRYELTLLNQNPSIPVGKVLGRPLTVRIKLDADRYRYFDGIVTYFSKLGSIMRHTRYGVVLQPSLSLLEHTRNSRVFNDASNYDPDPEGRASAQNALTIVSGVLMDLAVFHTPDVKSDHIYRDRRYCVQYRETDLNFVQRLLDEEGIYYFFRHETGNHEMILANSLKSHKKVKGYESVLYRPRERNQNFEREHFWDLRVAGSLFPGKFSVLRDYNFVELRPDKPQIEEAPSVLPDSRMPKDGETGLLEPYFEDYDYPGGLVDQKVAKDEALVRMQTELAANTLIQAEGNTMGLGVGDLLTLERATGDLGESPFWTEKDFKQEYLITSATYSVSVNQFETGETGHSDEPFRAKYTLLDTNTQYCPPRTATKPRIEGPQTAIVVGSKGDEIYTDKLGRVKVQFDWDNKHHRDQESSCWVRVAQIWAGKDWGSIHLPRVGQEVMVEFLDGDPDRPIITGRVYNADNMPPYKLPDNKSQSGIKSRSTKNGTKTGTASNFNEIRFEDLKDKEQLFIQAERDMDTNVKRNQSNTVGANRTVTVGGTQTTTVTKDETQTYKANRKMTVAETNTDEITGDHTGTYKANRTQTVTLKDALTVDKDKTCDVHGEYNSTADKQYKVVQGTNIIFMKGSDIVVNNGKCEISLSAGNATVVAPSSLTLQCGKATISLKQDGTIEVNGSQKVALSGGGSTVGLDAGGATMAGMKIGVSGQAVTEITGALIKIN